MSPSWFEVLLKRDVINSEAVLFTMFSVFVLNGHNSEECNVTWLMAHEAIRCTFRTSCTAVSKKCPFLWMLHNFRYSWLKEVRIFVGRVLHTGTDITLKIWYLGFFRFSFCQRYMVKKRRHHTAGGTVLYMFRGHYSTRDWVVRILNKSNFYVRKTLFPVYKT